MDTTHAHAHRTRADADADGDADVDVDLETWHALVDAIVADGPADALEALDDDYPADDLACLTIRLAEDPGASLVRELSRVDPSDLAPAAALEYLRATERAIAWLSARQADALVAIAGPRRRVTTHAVTTPATTTPATERSTTVTIEDASRSEIAAATRWSESWAHDRLTSARLLRDPLPLTRQALIRGEVSARHADAICAAAVRLDGYLAWLTHDTACAADAAVAEFTAQCHRLEQSVLPVARRGSITAARRSAERALARLDADHAARRRRAARADRDVTVVDEGDGHATLIAYLALEQAHACLAAVDRLARERRRATTETSTPGDRIGEHRVEALVRLLLGGEDRHSAAAGSAAAGSAAAGSTAARATATHRSPIRSHVDIVIDLPSLLGLADDPGTMRSGAPGGPVPIAADVVRRLVADDPDSTMRRLVAEPLSGHLLDRGRTTYRVPDRLRDYLVSRDVTCRFPGCHRRADLSQMDHAVPWDRGGGSDRANLGALCVRHHQLKTHAGWTIAASRLDGSCRWRSPAGLEYEQPPGFASSG